MALVKRWTKLLGGSDYDHAYSVATSSDGSIYAAGFTYGSIDQQTNNGNSDIFISKFNGDGSKAWTKLLGGSDGDYGYSVTTAIDGSIYVTGSTYGSINQQTNNGNGDSFISKLNSDGSKEWTKLFGGSDYDQALSVTTASDGSIYIAGYTYGSIDQQPNNGNGDSFISKFNSDGSKAWTKLFGGSGYDQANSVTTSSDGSVYVAGYTYSIIDQQPNNGSGDVFISKFNSDGSKAWTKLLGGSSYDYAYSVATSSDGSIYVAGYTYGSIDQQPNNGSGDAFISKFSSDGTKAWTKLLGGSSYDYATSVTIASDGSIYVAGFTTGSIDQQTSTGYYWNEFIAKFNSDGTKAWTKLFAGSDSGYANCVTTASDGSIYVAGTTYGSIDQQTNNGSGDAFLIKFAEERLNNRPTGTPSITGLPKAGSTLTIDASTIQDSDNFTGYKPTYQYSWETSTDGTTWSKLTSTDATDYNTTYTLTSAEVGKQVRGVVSYLDGYGTQETVVSAGSIPVVNPRPTLQSTTASNNQVIFAFSDAIKIAGGTSLATNLLTATVDGQTRKISSAQVDPANANQLLITLTGLSLDSVSYISVSYNAPASGATSGYLTNSVGTKLDAITNQVVDTYTATPNISKSGIGSAYQNLILASSATIGYGNAQNNTLTGNDGNNTLDGLEGADTMIGGKGDDTNVVDNIGDIVTEKSNEGTDTVQSSINYTLGANVENLILTGSHNLDGTGNELSNTITGNSGNNRLDGGTGVDKLIGNRGDDTYVVENAGDVVVESTSQGTDSVLASVNYTLTDNVENLTLTGTDSLTGIGNTLKNSIIGNSGNNLIDGKDGADVLTGLGGADTFQYSIKPITFSSNTADHITDFSSAQGDKIQIVKSAFGITNSTASLSVVSGSTQVSKTLATASLFVYDTSSGELHWNQNGITKGAGFGGVLAILDNKASLSSGDFVLV